MNCLRNSNIGISSLSQLFVTYKSTQTCVINGIVISGLRNFHSGNSNSLITAEYYINGRFNSQTLSPQVSTIVNIRMTGFYNKWPAERLWKGLTGVSNAGRKKGRVSGKKRKRAKNLNYGQHLGDGEINMVWPGLNAPVIKGKSLVQQQELPSKNEERLQRLTEIRDRMGVFKFAKLSPLERGWSGTKMPGRSIGPPEPVGEDKFQGFDTIVLEHKAVTKMDGRLGRKRRLSMLAVTGNKNGLAGFAMAKSGGSALDVARICKNKAAKRLVYIERCDNHTVFHDFYCNYLETKIFVQRKPEGFGLHCHPAIREICRIVGIKDLYAKVEGSTNVQKITKAFFLGLLNQNMEETFEGFQNSGKSPMRRVCSKTKCNNGLEEFDKHEKWVIHRLCIPNLRYPIRIMEEKFEGFQDAMKGPTERSCSKTNCNYGLGELHNHEKCVTHRNGISRSSLLCGKSMEYNFEAFQETDKGRRIVGSPAEYRNKLKDYDTHESFRGSVFRDLRGLMQ